MKTIASLDRYNTVTYHLRPRYLRARARKVGSYMLERLVARRRVRKLLRQCGQTKSP